MIVLNHDLIQDTGYSHVFQFFHIQVPYLVIKLQIGTGTYKVPIQVEKLNLVHATVSWFPILGCVLC